MAMEPAMINHRFGETLMYTKLKERTIMIIIRKLVHKKLGNRYSYSSML